MIYRKVAALYDIHGNLDALNAVLSEIDEMDIDAIVIGGDVVWGPAPRGVLERIMGLSHVTIVIRGNMDREVVERHTGPHGAMNEWCAAQLSSEQLHFLATLPLAAEIEVHGLREVLFVHASPRSDEEGIRVTMSHKELSDILTGVKQTYVVCGHTHARMDLPVNNTRILNGGSVGLPYGSRDAQWLLLGPEICFRKTPYDYMTAVQYNLQSQSPLGEAFAEQLRHPPSP